MSTQTRHSIIEEAALIEQPPHKFRQKIESLNNRGIAIAPVSDTVSQGELVIVLKDYLRLPNRLNGKLPKVTQRLTELNQEPAPPTEPTPEAQPKPKPEMSTEPTPNNEPKPQPTPIIQPEPQPSPVKQQPEILTRTIAQPTGKNPVAWFFYLAYRALNPVQQFFETQEVMLFFAFALISVQSWQIGDAYMENSPNPTLLIAAIFAVAFELTGLVLTIKSAKVGYLVGFGLLSAVVNLCHAHILEPFNNEAWTTEKAIYVFALRLVFSVGLPFAIFSFNHQYVKTQQ